MRLLSSTQSIWNKISPPFCSHLTIALIHERSIYTYGTQRTAIKFKIQLSFFFFFTLDCFGNHTFSSMPSPPIIPLYFPFVMAVQIKYVVKVNTPTAKY